jgi:hypothetical protein
MSAACRRGSTPARPALAALLALAVGACGGGGGPAQDDAGCYAPDARFCNGTEAPYAATCVVPPDETVIADPTDVASLTVAGYQQEVYRRYLEADGLPSKQITALVGTAGGTLWAGTAAGLARLDTSQSLPRFVAAAGTPGTSPITALAVESGENLVVGLDGSVGYLRAGAWEDVMVIPGAGVTAVAQDGSVTWVGTTHGLYRVSYPVVTADDTLTDEVKAIAVGGGAALVATTAGLRRGAFGAWTAVSGVPHDDVRALAVEPDGRVLAGTAAGLALLDGATVVETIRGGALALPFEDVTAVATGADGTRLVGFARGAARPRDDAWHLYLSRRWTPADTMTAVALADGGVYLGTAEGLGAITTVPMTLADKAVYYETGTEARHVRMDGFVTTDVALTDPDDLSQGAAYPGDEDNDGLWTQMHIGALCLGYAATGDEQLYQHARRSLANMFLLIDVPGTFNPAIDGYVSRSLVREDETELWQRKLAEPERWRGPVDYQGHRYLWKNDTSSDEVVGHYFGYGLYYDLCARDEAERQEIRDHVARLTDYILKGCFYLLDEDGEPTTFGQWGPEFVNEGFAANVGSRGLNGTEIMSHLRTAFHITGDARYEQAFQYLVQAHAYDENVRKAHDYMKVAIINHSDDELLFLSYYPLLRYEPDPARRAIWEEAVTRSYDDEPWPLRPERNPAWAFIYAYANGSGPQVEAAIADAVRTLAEYPLDLRQYFVDNTGRMDYVLHEKLDRFKDPQFTAVPPADERRVHKWNSNPFTVKDGGDEWGSAELSSSHWLLAYYLGLHHGFIK